MAAAIRSLSSLRSLSSVQGKRVAILGDMKELGADSAELHREIGRLASQKKIDLLICCGEEAKYIYDGYMENSENGHYFATKEELYTVLGSFIQRGDVVLVKASHSMEFENIVDRLKKVQHI
jgi:UDP-N-acetylmuramoyl-tripeptide--D-alanyl-D-alanine ligase